jgi:hypothetical protein
LQIENRRGEIQENELKMKKILRILQKSLSYRDNNIVDQGITPCSEDLED